MINKITDQDIFKDICDLTCEVVGLKRGSLKQRSRKHEIHIPRLVASYIARSECTIPYHIIAKGINRDRSLIYHYESSHKNNFASSAKYRRIFTAVYTRYKGIIESKLTFKTSGEMKKHIMEFTKDVMAPQIFIIVTSGNVKCVIKTDYSNFAKSLKNVKIALLNYSHTIDIQLE